MPGWIKSRSTVGPSTVSKRTLSDTWSFSGLPPGSSGLVARTRTHPRRRQGDRYDAQGLETKSVLLLMEEFRTLSSTSRSVVPFAALREDRTWGVDGAGMVHLIVDARPYLRMYDEAKATWLRVCHLALVFSSSADQHLDISRSHRPNHSPSFQPSALSARLSTCDFPAAVRRRCRATSV